MLGRNSVAYSRLVKLCFNISNLRNIHFKCIDKTILLCYRLYITNHRFYYKTYTFLLTTVHLSTKIIRESYYLFGQQDAEMGLISLTWVFCHNLVKIRLGVIEILSFSFSVLLLIKADDDHLAVPNCIKKSSWLNAKIIVTQSWYNSTERFFPVLYFAILVRDAILSGLFLFNFKATHCKNHFLVKFFDKFGQNPLSGY